MVVQLRIKASAGPDKKAIPPAKAGLVCSKCQFPVDKPGLCAKCQYEKMVPWVGTLLKMAWGILGIAMLRNNPIAIALLQLVCYFSAFALIDVILKFTSGFMLDRIEWV